MRALVVRLGRPPVVGFYDEDFMLVGVNQAAYYAIGSGEGLAFGAMAHGAGAVDAVKAAICHDAESGYPISWINLITGEEGTA